MSEDGDRYGRQIIAELQETEIPGQGSATDGRGIPSLPRLRGRSHLPAFEFSESSPLEEEGPKR